MLSIFDYLFAFEILIVLMASGTLTLFPLIILRTISISTHYRFLLLLLWVSHLLLVLAQLISIVLRIIWQDIQMNLFIIPFEAYQTFRLTHEVGFFFSTTAMILLVYDRFLFTIYYQVEMRQKYFRIVMHFLVPLGLFIACYAAYRATVDEKVIEACLIAHACDAVSCVFCVITYFRSRRKYRESFTHVTLNTRFLLFESQELTYALLPVCIMAVILKTASLTSIWMYAINRASIPIPCVLLVFYSVNTINVFLSQALLVRWHRLLWKRFKEIIGFKQEIQTAPSEKEQAIIIYKEKKLQYAAYFEMMDKQWR